MEINKTDTAVLALHWMVDVVKAEGAYGPFFAEMVDTTGVVPRTAEVLERARSAGIPVIYTRVCFRPDYSDLLVNSPLLAMVLEKNAMVDGSRGAEIIEELAPQPGDFVVNHCRISPFYGSELNTILRKYGIKNVVLTGVATNLTVEGTAREAGNEGYNVVILNDCCTAASADIHRASMETLGLICASISSADEFLKSIGPS